MKYISIDLETTGLDEQNNQILEFGAIIDDTDNPLSYEESPKFHRIIRHRDYRGDAYALALNVDLMNILSGQREVPEGCSIIYLHELFNEFTQWAFAEGVPSKFNVAGKNFAGFDRKFLDRYTEQWDAFLHHRVIDVGSLWVDWSVDEVLPNLSDALYRATGDHPTELHTALGDCWDVIKCVRADVARKNIIQSMERAIESQRQPDNPEFDPYNEFSPEGWGKVFWEDYVERNPI